MMKNRFRVLSLLMAILFLLTSCQLQSNTDSVVVNDKTLRFMLLEEPNELDPSAANESYATPITYHTFEPLLLIDENGELKPGVAKSWLVTDNNTTFTFTLRENSKWSDGQVVSAHDFVNTYLRILSPTSPTQNSGLLSPYILGANDYMSGDLDVSQVGIKAIDDFTLEIKTSASTPYFLQVLAFGNLSPVRMDIVEAKGEEWDQMSDSYIGNGAFYLTSYTKGKEIILTKNPDYWNAENIKLDSIVFLFRQENQDPIDLFLEGEIDGIYELTANELRVHPELEPNVYTHVAPSTSFIVINHKKLLFKNSDFRKALEMGIDRKELVDEVIIGAGIPSQYLVPLTYTLNGESFHDYTELDKSPDYNSAKAIIKDLKSRNLISDDRPIQIFAMDSGPDADLAKKIASNYKTQLDLNVEVTIMPWGELFSKSLAGEYDLIMLGFGGDYPHPMTFLSNFIEDGILTKILNWHNPEYDKLVIQTLETSDEAVALKKLRELEMMVIEDNHIINLYHRKKVNLMSTRVKGWFRNSSSVYVFTNAYIE